jgi:hypothetical protein
VYGPTVLSRMRFIASQADKTSTSIPMANARDVGEWLGASTEGIFNFHPMYVRSRVSCNRYMVVAINASKNLLHTTILRVVHHALKQQCPTQPLSPLDAFGSLRLQTRHSREVPCPDECRTGLLQEPLHPVFGCIMDQDTRDTTRINTHTSSTANHLQNIRRSVYMITKHFLQSRAWREDRHSSEDLDMIVFQTFFHKCTVRGCQPFMIESNAKRECMAQDTVMDRLNHVLSNQSV